VIVIDPLPDELALARAQIDSGLPALAEGTVRRRLAWLEAEGNAAAGDEMDALRLLLAEAAWRQHRPAQARVALESMRPGSARRHLPIALLIEAESLAATGEMDRAQGVGERLLASVSADEVFELRRGMPGRLSWPPPAELRSEPRRTARAPWARPAADGPAGGAEPDDERVIAARSRLEQARAAYVAGDLAGGDGLLSVALRLDPAIGADGVLIVEPTLGDQPDSDRLLLYGDLLGAAGRVTEAQAAFGRAAARDA